MGDLVYLVRAEDHVRDLDDLPTGPPPRLQRPTYRTDRRLDDWLAGERVDWTAETAGPLLRPRLVALDGGVSSRPNEQRQPGRPVGDAQDFGPGGQHE